MDGADCMGDFLAKAKIIGIISMAIALKRREGKIQKSVLT
jgi:hypothetical protein